MAYVMNEYSILTYGFKQKHIAECVRDGRISEEFQCMSAPSDLYDYVRIEQIDALNQEAGLEQHQNYHTGRPCQLYASGAKQSD